MADERKGPTGQMLKRHPLRVLLIAEACNPEWTSVPLVGFNFANALSRRSELELTLASHPRNRDALERHEIAKRVRLVFADNDYVAATLYKLAQVLRGGGGKGWTTNTAFSSFSYLFFEWELWKLMKREVKAGMFDVIHRITPVTPTVGSPICQWAADDVPMVIGPLNGGLPWPPEYPSLRHRENEFLVPLRQAYRVLPFWAATYRHAAAVISGSQHTHTEIPSFFKGRKVLLPENGVDPSRFEIKDSWTPPRGKFQFVSVGRLVPYKGFWLTLRALALSPRLRAESELILLGDGPERDRLAVLAAELGIAEQVHFRGQMSQHELARVMRDSQAFVFPSLREFGGGVVLEAMACGLPSIIVDYGGPQDLIDSSCGRLLPMVPEEEMVRQLSAAMEELVSSPSLCAGLAAHAAARVRSEFLWDVKAEKLSRIYHEVTGTNRPITAPPAQTH